MCSELGLNKEKIDKRIEELKEKQRLYIENNEDYHRDTDYHTERTPYCVEITDLSYESNLLNFTDDVERCHFGHEVNKKYVITKTRRWKVKGGNTWYWYKSIEDLFEKHINKKYEVSKK